LPRLTLEFSQLHAHGRRRPTKTHGGMREAAKINADDHGSKRIHIEVQGLHFRYSEMPFANYAIF
jgi:hypothetical protein